MGRRAGLTGARGCQCALLVMIHNSVGGSASNATTTPPGEEEASDGFLDDNTGRFLLIAMIVAAIVLVGTVAYCVWFTHQPDPKIMDNARAASMHSVQMQRYLMAQQLAAVGSPQHQYHHAASISMARISPTARAQPQQPAPVMPASAGTDPAPAKTLATQPAAESLYILPVDSFYGVSERDMDKMLAVPSTGTGARNHDGEDTSPSPPPPMGQRQQSMPQLHHQSRNTLVGPPVEPPPRIASSHRLENKPGQPHRPRLPVYASSRFRLQPLQAEASPKLFRIASRRVVEDPQATERAAPATPRVIREYRSKAKMHHEGSQAELSHEASTGRMTNGGDRQDQAVRALVNNATVPLPRAGSVDSTQTGVRTMPVVPTPVVPPRRGESSRRVKRGGRRARGGGGSSRKKRPSSTGRVRKGKGKGKGSG